MSVNDTDNLNPCFQTGNWQSAAQRSSFPCNDLAEDAQHHLPTRPWLSGRLRRDEACNELSDQAADTIDALYDALDELTDCVARRVNVQLAQQRAVDAMAMARRVERRWSADRGYYAVQVKS